MELVEDIAITDEGIGCIVTQRSLVGQSRYVRIGFLAHLPFSIGCVHVAEKVAEQIAAAIGWAAPDAQRSDADVREIERLQAALLQAQIDQETVQAAATVLTAWTTLVGVGRETGTKILEAAGADR